MLTGRERIHWNSNFSDLEENIAMTATALSDAVEKKISDVFFGEMLRNKTMRVLSP